VGTHRGSSASPSAVDPASTSGRWVDRPSLSHARGGLDVATMGGLILAIGGFDPNSGEVFDFVEARLIGGNGTWHDLAPLPIASSNAAIAVLDESVYVAGGYSTTEGLDVVQRFNARSRSWESSPRLPQQRGAGAAAALAGRLYVAGGYVGPADEETASVIMFDPATRKWTPVAPMHQSRGFLRMVAANGHLYAIGGNHGGLTVATVERYNPASNTWTTITPMRQDRGVPGAVLTTLGSQHLIVIVGGSHITESEGIALRSTEVYNVNTGKWQTLSAQLPTARTSLGCAVQADGSILAVGGEVVINGVGQASAAVEALSLG
jgi:N-acetylneuraminic acid mutarotase